MQSANLRDCNMIAKGRSDDLEFQEENFKA